MHNRRRKRNPYFQTIGAILQKTLKKRQLSLPAKDFQIWEAWSRSVGPLISAQTAYDNFRNGTLFIKVANSVWMQQLQFMKKEIIEKANAVLGREAVKNIFFSVGRVAAVKPGGVEDFSATSDPDPLTEKDQRQVELSTASVNDSELKEILRRVMTKDLRRRRQREG
jgi:predicted nucleic acid-binding Zn ribbon protein